MKTKTNYERKKKYVVENIFSQLNMEILVKEINISFIITK